ncbi:hypothetical protein [Enterobacter asburiae]|uniref:hypothetical protein n=1 Tax=Enterobacter asburiae TaxID=61645 RepID=UPI0004092369|nr:hypothetical protein [Enterobacter asburiae]AHW95845.1 hypothetical protein DI57_15960 [Enterobacter asburiae L1]QVK35991.1 hypothetical protein KIJ47_15995 [Enterobacter asburiae]
MSKTKVLFAYCHELDRCISIDEARTEFFSRKPHDRQRFTFSCGDRNCNVTISGVNYHVKAEDGKKFKVAHFRSPHPHNLGCEWMQFSEEANQPRQPNETEADYTERKARQKLNDFINCFDPCTDEKDSQQKESGQLTSLSQVNYHVKDDDLSDEKSHKWSRYTRTNQLQRLVDTWQEAKRTLTYDEFRALRLRVTNYGNIHFHKYITHIQKGLKNQYAGVIFGGGSLVKRYGRGFLINFFDKHNDKPIRLYIDKNLMEKGRISHYIDEILSTENVRYFRVFLLNPEVSEKKDRTGKPVINLEISSLQQLAIYYELDSSEDNDFD